MSTNQTLRSNYGFTIIEIMVVIVILGILAGVGAPKLIGYTEKVREKADLMKLYYLRDALNRALLESDQALYQSSFVTSGNKAEENLSKLKKKLASETGVDLFVIEMRPDLPTNIQNNHSSINSGSEMSKIIGSSGTWYDALRDAGFEGVADILEARNSGTSLKKDGATYYSLEYKQGNSTYYRTYPKEQIFMSKLLNHGKSAGLSGITTQGGNNTNYRLTLNFQWCGMDSTTHAVEAALLPAGGKMREASGKGGALLSDNGVCFSTYGDIGCANYRY